MTRALVFVWSHLGPDHADRAAAAARALGPAWRVVAAGLAARTATYAWSPPEPGGGAVHTTLVPGRALHEVSRARRFAAVARLLARERPAIAFLCHYERPETWAAAWLARALGARPVVMFDSTRADAVRRPWREAGKRAALWPYAGALASGERALDYLATLGVPRARGVPGYDTLDTARVRANAGGAVATPHSHRPFVLIARLVAKKNIAGALDAYTRYRTAMQAAGVPPRGLVLVGEGPARPAYPPAGVTLTGALDPPAAHRWLGTALALLLPSRSEQWGLVVNEALALGVPVLVSERAGAAELIAEGETGHRVPPDDTAALVQHMARLTREPATWHRMAAAARSAAPLGDVRHFVNAVRAWLPQ